MNPTNGTYHAVAKTLHWAMAAVMIALWGVGHLMQELPKGALRGTVYDCHKQLGIAILVLAFVRLGWRLWKGAPALDTAMPALQRLGAHLVHLALYGLMFALPASGIVNSQSGGHPVKLLGLRLPVLVGKEPALHELAEDGHALLGWVLLLLVAGHVAAALYHHFKLKDDTLVRMLPSRSVTP